MGFVFLSLSFASALPGIVAESMAGNLSPSAQPRLFWVLRQLTRFRGRDYLEKGEVVVCCL
jgi:hypothetical protein